MMVMRSVMCSWILSLGLVAAIPVEGADGTRSFKMPILSVNAQTGGDLSQLPFSYERVPSDTPLKILIADDTPAGSGASIRSSVWLAAVTAGMQRNDPMNGVRITVEFSGNVDGPSAGGVMCLSILSAMDGRLLPTDFAMTGTIMPDGTIGLVGGVAQKMRAAIAKGCKRICIPAFLRFEKQDDGELVDLFRIGEKQNVEVRPVRSIAEAYAFAHKLPMPTLRAIDEAAILKLPKKAEDVLIARYALLEEEIRRLRGGVLKDVQKELKKNDLLAKFLFDDVATRQYVSGKLLSACSSALSAKCAWSVVKRWEKRLQEISKRYPVLMQDPPFSKSDQKAFIAAITDLQKDYSKEVIAVIKGVSPDIKSSQPKSLGYFRGVEDLSEIAAQGENAADSFGLGGLLQSLDRIDITKMKNLSDEDLENFFEAEGGKIFILYLVQTALAETARDDLQVKLFQSFPRCQLNQRGERVEKLFYSAWTAVDEAIAADIVNDYAEQAEIRESEMISTLTFKDPSYAEYTFAKAFARVMHSWLEQPELLCDPKYHAAATLSVNANAFAKSCTFLIKYGVDLGGSFNNNDDYVCSNYEFLNYLVRHAREHALLAIDECVRAGIPCPSVLEVFEEADGHDVTKTDADAVIHSVLENYWRANLGAKALLMGFAAEPRTL